MKQPTIKELLAPIFGAVKEYECDGMRINITTENGKYSYWKTTKVDGEDMDTEELLIKRAQQMEAKHTRDLNATKMCDNAIKDKTRRVKFMLENVDDTLRIFDGTADRETKKRFEKANIWKPNPRDRELRKAFDLFFQMYKLKQNNKPEPTTMRYAGHWFFFF